MKKLLLSISLLVVAFTQAQNQNVYNYGFVSPTTTMTSTDGWARTNQSTTPSTTALWSVSSYAVVASVSAATPASAFQNQVYATGQSCPIPNGQDGAPNSFALVNYASTSSTLTTGATISNWLISPMITVQNGDVVTFYTRKGTSGTSDFPDRLELRMSSSPATNPSSGATDTGSFSTLCTSVNPDLLNGFVYSKTWTQYSYTVTGLTVATDVKFAFRYFVTDAGTNGANSDIIGIDTFSVDRALASTESFFKNNLSIYPNPTKGNLNINSDTNVTINNAVLTDLNGRIIKNVNLNGVSNPTIDITDVNTGVYFLKVTTDQGVGTSKVIKN
jgi:hypothetical protein